MDKNDSIPELKSFALVAEEQSDLDAVRNNSRTEITGAWMFRKMRAVFQRLPTVFQKNTLNAVEEPEVDPEQSCVPDPIVSEPEPTGASVDVGSDQGGENISPTESTTGRKTKKIRSIFWRLCAVFQTKTPKSVEQPEVDLPDPEDSCFPDPVAPESEPEMDLVGIEQPCIPEPEGNLVASPEPKLDLVDPQKSCVSQTEPEPEEDLDSWILDTEYECDLVDLVDLYAPGPSDPELHPEEDLDDPPEHEWGVVDSVELYRTPWTNILKGEMPKEGREVRLEVYVNGAFYSADSYWASDDKDVQLEFEITDAIYDFIGCDASREIDVQLEVETDDHVSVSYCSPGDTKVQLEVDGNENISVCKMEDLQLEMDKNDSIPELKSFALVAEEQSDLDAVRNNSRTEKTAGRMFRKMKAVFQRLSAVFQTKTPNAVEEPEVDPEQSCVPDPSVSEPEPTGASVDVDIDQDGLDTGLNISPTECTTGRKTKKIRSIFWRLCAVFQTKTPKSVEQPEVDLPDPEDSCFPDPAAPESEPEMDLVGIEQPCIPEPEGNLVASPEPKLDLVDPQKSCVSQTEPEPEEDLDSWILDTEYECDLVDLVDLYAPGPSDPELHPEEDLDDPPEHEWGVVNSVELYRTPRTNIQPEPEEDLDSWILDTEYECDLVDLVDLYAPGPSDPELHPEEDLDDPPEHEWGVVNSVELYRTPRTNIPAGFESR
ncbi:hypothetical protein ROHU_002372 [Labeo rohita]|uniref:Uncharacterized protein n=1 Tax=Labeo rohita TaxID=84645 RepID=A0A498NXU4_LABRO|nr:hypothetical protein ROHU_002372 [Labeo rohita]